MKLPSLCLTLIYCRHTQPAHTQLQSHRTPAAHYAVYLIKARSPESVAPSSFLKTTATTKLTRIAFFRVRSRKLTFQSRC